jgi:prepilin-type N-terminal cleavage/methylation domain-containing protein
METQAKIRFKPYNKCMKLCPIHSRITSRCTDSVDRKLAQNGFTLIELIIVLIIMAILAALAAPSFVETIRNNRVINASQQFQTAVFTARSASLTRGARVSIAPLTSGVYPVESWSNGWVVFVDANNNGIFEGTEVVLLRQEAWGSAAGSTDYFFSTTAAVPAGRMLGVPSYVAGRPQTITGALGAYSFVSALNDKATGGTSAVTASAKHWRTSCVAVTGRIRLLKPGDPGVTISGVCPE